MRSRYAAFVLCDEPYLLATWHPRTRPASVPFDRNQKWLGLKIVDAREKGTDLFSGDNGCKYDSSPFPSFQSSPVHAEVEFIARYRVGGGSAARLHERSRFVREDNRWFYVDGDLLQ